MKKKANNRKQILVTCALPYANGAIHLGHMLEHIQADIWVRFQRLQGHETYFICADDAHGTPVMLKAKQLNLSPVAMIEQMRTAHKNDFARFNISFDNYHSTHSDENRQLVEQIYHRLKKQKHIKTRKVAQLFDSEMGLFLPDRFVKGICPRCQTPDQYGDNCENCGSTYNPTELIDPKSVISDSTPIIKESKHYFFNLPAFENMLKAWTQSDSLQKEVSNKLQEWFHSGLQPWDISRDAPYFGFEIPQAPGKYFYVWLDAPIGYMASFKNFTNRTPHVAFEHFWHPDSTTELYHFIGKDVVYFHSLFWPAILTGSQYRKPTNIFVHGHVTVNGSKMSKSKGTFIEANTYLRHLDADYLRYYYATKLTCHIDDIDLNLTDFIHRVNSDLVNKVVNLASRVASFITQRFDHQLSDKLDNQALYQKFVGKLDIIAGYYQAREFAKITREIILLADDANRYVDEKAPWVMAKKPEEALQLHLVCTTTINLFKTVMTYLKPIVPTLAQRVEQFLNTELSFNHLATPLLNHTINKFEPLLQRLNQKQIAAILQETKQMGTPKEQQQIMESSTTTQLLPSTIKWNDFVKVDLRIALITGVDAVEGSDKLLKLTLDIGSESRQVFSAIRKAYPDFKQLEGRLTVMVTNLAPRKMRFGLSEGMLLVAAGDDNNIFLLSPDSGAKPGMSVH